MLKFKNQDAYEARFRALQIVDERAAVKSVNGVLPDDAGAITLTPANINAVSVEDIANIRGTFRINVTSSDGVYSADKTFDEIKAAYESGQLPYVVYTSLTSNFVYTFAMASPKFMCFESYSISGDTLETVSLRIFSYTLENGSNIEKQVSPYNGQNGVGIQSVVQTTTSTEDGGANIITVTKTDGTSSTFTVRNGSKGSTGATGATGAAGKDGRTPMRGTDYWTADDIADIKKYIDGTASSGAAAVVIEGTISPDASAVTITTPDAWSIVYEAWSSDRHPPVVLRLTTGIDEAAFYAYLICVIIADVDVRFALFSLAEIAYLDNTLPYTITLNDNNTAEIEPAIDTSMSDTSGAAVQNKVVKKYIDDNAQPKGDYALRSELFSGSYNDLTNKPVSMKNPFALTIKIGSTTVTYDGSAAKTVEIADGSEVAY